LNESLLKQKDDEIAQLKKNMLLREFQLSSIFKLVTLEASEEGKKDNGEQLQ
jgi:hypothetical protein